MLIHYNDNGVVTWRNEFLSEALAERYCVYENTIWIADTTTPEVPDEYTQDDVVLMYSPEDGLYYEYAEEEEPVYSNTQLIMQELTNIELLILEGEMS